MDGGAWWAAVHGVAKSQINWSHGAGSGWGATADSRNRTTGRGRGASAIERGVAGKGGQKASLSLS